MNVGIIRCLMTEDISRGTTDFIVTKEGKRAFEKTGPVAIVGLTTCDGCPGRRIPPRAKMMAERGTDAKSPATSIVVRQTCG